VATGASVARITAWQPLAVPERYSVLDLARGLSLFGVLAINLLYYFRLPLFAHILEFPIRMPAG